MVTPLAVITGLSVAAPAFVDIPVPEIEPNQTRETATPATPAAANLNAFSGTCRGFDATPSSTTDDTRDLWRVTINAAPLVIQRHRLQLTTTGTQGHTGTVLGVQANSGVVDPASMVSLQNTSISTVPARFCQLYTLATADGTPPSFLYRVTGSAGTSLPYTVTLSSETVTPVPVTRACPFVAGQFTITTVGRTTLNTKIFLYNADTLAPIEGGLNDDTPLSPTATSPQSTLTRVLPPGNYILAIANGGTADHQLPPADDRASAQPIAYLAQTPGVLVSSSSTATGDFSFRIEDALGSDRGVNVVAAKPGAFGVAFYKFEAKARCGQADIGAAGAYACFDLLLDNNDFIVFIDTFFRRTPGSDIGKAGGWPGSDGLWDNNDWAVYIDQFFNGC